MPTLTTSVWYFPGRPNPWSEESGEGEEEVRHEDWKGKSKNLSHVQHDCLCRVYRIYIKFLEQRSAFLYTSNKQ